MMTLGVIVVARTSSFVLGRPGRNNKNSPPRMRPQMTLSAQVCPSPGTTPWLEHMAITLGRAARTSSFALGRPGHNNKNSPPRMRPQMTISAEVCLSPRATLWLEQKALTVVVHMRSL